MKEEPLDEHLRVLQGLQWKNQTNVLDQLFERLHEKEQNESMRWMAAASFVAILFSGMLFYAGKHAQQEITQIQLESVAKSYAVNNLTY
jgi:DNA-binding MurR/RpiR family transcriptional regulator